LDAIEITLNNISSDRQLRYENYQVVSAVQALCGGITQNMLAVTLSCRGAVVHLHFYLENESACDRDEIEDSVTELEALQFTAVPVVAHVHVSMPVASSQLEGRVIYRRYEGHAQGNPVNPLEASHPA
jgi:hypothetical protein